MPWVEESSITGTWEEAFQGAFQYNAFQVNAFQVTATIGWSEPSSVDTSWVENSAESSDWEEPEMIDSSWAEESEL